MLEYPQAGMVDVLEESIVTQIVIFDYSALHVPGIHDVPNYVNPKLLHL